jgi:hypothetical protein
MKSEPDLLTAPPPSWKDRKVLILIALLILITVTLYSQWNTGVPRNNSTSAPATQVRKRLSGASDDPEFLFSKLKDEHLVFDNEKRNLFDFYQPPPPPPSPAQQQAAAEEQQKPQVVCGDQICQGEETYENCPTDCQPPPPPDIPLRYIGYLAEEGGPVVFLTDGKEVFMGRENDVIANKYRILKITDQSVELGYLNANQSRSIPFQGNNQS